MEHLNPFLRDHEATSYLIRHTGYVTEVVLCFVTLDGSFWDHHHHVLILTPLGRVLDLVYCNIKRYKRIMELLLFPTLPPSNIQEENQSTN